MSENANRTYLLRVWREPEHDGPSLFRAVLTDVGTRETRYFSDVTDLAQHLRSLEARQEPDEG